MNPSPEPSFSSSPAGGSSSADTRQTSWPIGLYLGMMAYSFGALVFMTPLFNPWLNAGVRTLAQYALVMLLLTRLATAIKGREQNHQGRIYVVVLLVLPVLWYMLEVILLPWLQWLMR